jgi:hypothetical protein
MMNQPKPLNNRLDFLKDERPQKPPPRKVYPYTTSNYRKQEVKRELQPQKRELLPTNDRFKYLNTETKPPPVKKGFVAMPSRKLWDEGYRPGWMIRSEGEPPDNYDVGLKMFKHYVQTGEVIFNKSKFKGDKAKQLGTSFMNTMNKKKGK